MKTKMKRILKIIIIIDNGTGHQPKDLIPRKKFPKNTEADTCGVWRSD